MQSFLSTGGQTFRLGVRERIPGSLSKSTMLFELHNCVVIMNRVFPVRKRQRRRPKACRATRRRRVGLFESLESRRLLAIAIDVGTHYLLPNTPGQEIDIYATGLPEDRVAGFITRAQLGDGNGPLVEPIFMALKYENSIWGTLQQTATGGPVRNFPMVVQGSITHDTLDQTVEANGLTVT